MKGDVPAIIPSAAPETGDIALHRLLDPACFFDDPCASLQRPISIARSSTHTSRQRSDAGARIARLQLDA